MVAPGEPAPSATFEAIDGQRVRLEDLRGRPVVLFFYPADFTTVCTKEVCGFRDRFDDFQAAGVEVLGVSRDPPESHDRFANTYDLPYRLLSDPDGSAHRAFGVGRTLGLFGQRITFVIDAKGIVQARIKSASNANKHVREALAALPRPAQARA